MKNLHQAKVIEELIKKKVAHSPEKANTDDLYEILDELNGQFVELIKKFKQLEKERLSLIKIVEDLDKTSEMMETEFSIQFDQLKQLIKEKKKHAKEKK